MGFWILDFGLGIGDWGLGIGDIGFWIWIPGWIRRCRCPASIQNLKSKIEFGCTDARCLLQSKIQNPKSKIEFGGADAPASIQNPKSKIELIPYCGMSLYTVPL
jgi:hypothetical protein